MDLDVEYFGLAENAYKRIKDALLKHEIAPGALVSQDELVLRLKIGRTVIGEALARMAQEGYVNQISRQRYRVSEITAEEVAELFDLRQVLETYCIEEAIRRITPDGIDALELSVKSTRKAITTNQPLVNRYLINKDFHLIIAEIAGNSAVCRVLEDSCEKLLLKRPGEGSRGDFAVLRHHRDIMRAIKNQETHHAQDLMKSHLDEIKYTLLKQIAVRTREAQAR